MNLKERAKRDFERFTTNTNEWAETMVLIPPQGSELMIQGIHSLHSLGYNATLKDFVNTKNGHINFAEQLLVDGVYDYMDADGNVFLQHHKVRLTDLVTGELKTFKIDQWFPDRTIGSIMCTLGDYTAS